MIELFFSTTIVYFRVEKVNTTNTTIFMVVVFIFGVKPLLPQNNRLFFEVFIVLARPKDYDDVDQKPPAITK